MAALTGYLALGTITDSGVFTEISGASGYARQAVSLSPSGDGGVSNDAAVTFPASSGANWAKFDALAIYTALTGGSPLLAWRAPAMGRAAHSSASTYPIPAGAIQLSFPVVKSSLGTPVAMSSDFSWSPSGVTFSPGPAPSSRYKFFIPGKQFAGSGNPKDFSGNSADAIISSAHSDAAAWANKGYLTAVAGTGKSFAVPLAKATFDLATQSVIFSTVINKAAPAASEAIFGNADATSNQGFYLSARITSGKIRPILNTSGGVVAGLADSTAVFCDGTDHVLTLAIDGLTKAVYLYMDGILSDTYNAAFSGGTSPVVQFCMGCAPTNSNATSASFDLKANSAHLLVFTGGLPANVNLLAQRLAASPTRFLSDAELA